MVVLNNQESQYKVPDTDLNIEGLTDDELRTYLNHKTLEQQPNSFKFILEEICLRDMEVSDIINNTSVYETYYSTLMHCVIYLTGNLIRQGSCFYGSDYSIPDNIGLEIMSLIFGRSKHRKLL